MIKFCSSPGEFRPDRVRLNQEYSRISTDVEHADSVNSRRSNGSVSAEIEALDLDVARDIPRSTIVWARRNIDQIVSRSIGFKSRV